MRTSLVGRFGVPVALFVIVAVVAVLLSAGPPALGITVVVALINLVLAVGLYIFVGNSGVYSFGQLGFALIGAYVAGLLVMPTDLKQMSLSNAPEWLQTIHLAPWLAVIVAGVVAVIAGVVVVVPLSRINGLAAGLATVALLIVVKVVASQWDSITRGERGLSSIPAGTTLWMALAWVFVTLMVAWIYQRSRAGKQLRASKADEVAASAAGINIAFHRGGAFLLSAFFNGVGGALFAMFLGSVSPEVFYLDYTFLIITMVVIGGADSLTGVVTGVVVVATLQELLRQIESGRVLGLFSVPSRPGIAEVVLGVVLVLTLIKRRNGITGGKEIRPERWFVRTADRRPDRSTVVGASADPVAPSVDDGAPG